MEHFKKGYLLKKKISGQCPCGYYFEGFNNPDEAILQLQSHVERFHSDFLPFGITKDEAGALLKIEYAERKKEYKGNRVKYPPITEQHFSSKETNARLGEKQKVRELLV